MTKKVSLDSNHSTPSVTAELLDVAIDPSSTMIVSCLLGGRMVAASAEKITEDEKAVFRESIQGSLHFAEPELITAFLEEAMRGEYEPENDLSHLAKLVESFDHYANLHLFAFACEVASVRLESLPEELPVLSKLATLLGVNIHHKDALLYVYCKYSGGLSPDRHTLEEIISVLHPDVLPEFGVAIHEMAIDHVRRVEEHLAERGLGDSVESTVERGRVESDEEVDSEQASPSRGGDADTQGATSKLAESVNHTPKKETLLEVSERVQELPSEVLYERHREDVKRINERVADDQFRISVVGAFSSGKSTLLNALCREVGEELFPTAMIPCTGAVTVLRYGPQVKYWKRSTKNDHEEVISRDEFKQLVELPPTMERIDHLSATDLDALVVDYPLTLCESGIEIVDSPGLNENPQRTRITEQYLKQSDAVIYVMTVQQMASLQDRKHVEELVDRIGTDNLFFVINCYDKVAGTGDEEKVLARAQSFFEKVYEDEIDNWFNERIHFLSALEVVNHSQNGQSESQYVHDFQSFEAIVGNYLADVKGAKRLQQLSDELMEVLARTYVHAESLAHEVTLDIEDVEEERSSLKAALRQFKRSKQKIRRAEESAEHTIKRAAKNIFRDIDDTLEDWFARLPKHLQKRSTQWESDASPLFSKKQIQKDFSEQAQEDISSFINSWKEEAAMPTIANHFEEMIRHLNKDFEDIKEEMNELRSLSDKTFEAPEDSEDSGAFISFVRGAAGFAAGGPLGAFVGATMNWKDVAVNAATNTAIGFGLGVAGIASGGVLIPLVAIVGAVQAWKGADKIRESIRQQTLETATDHISEIRGQVTSSVRTELGSNLNEMAEQTRELVERELSEIEEQIRQELSALEQISEEAEEQKRLLSEKESRVAQVKAISGKVAPLSSLSFEEIVSQTGHSVDRVT